MIELYLRRSGDYEAMQADERLLRKMDQVRRERFLTTDSEKVRLESLGTALLLHEVLCARIGLDCESAPAFTYGYTKNGKPYLEDPEYSHIHFNVTHSGEWICCAIGDVPVGVDLQKIGAPERTERELQIAKRFFTEEEYEDLVRSKDKEQEYLQKEWINSNSRFAQLWAIKEAYVKLRGGRVVDGLDRFCIRFDGEKALEIREMDRCTAVVWEPDTADCPAMHRLAVCTERPEEIRMHCL